MKKKLTFVLLFVATMQLMAQDETLGKKILVNSKNKTYQKGEQKADETVDEVLNAAEDKIKNLFKKKEKKKKSEQDTESETNNSVESNNNQNQENATSKSKNVKSNSKFDFEAGTKELYFDNFKRLSIGDFPKEYNSNASGEIITLDGKEGKWLNMTKNGAFVPDNIKKLPNNFTLEFEIGIDKDPSNNYSGFGLNFSTVPDNLMLEMFFGKGNSVVYLHPGAAEASIFVNPLSGSEISNSVKMPQWDARNETNFAKVSVWRQEGRLRVYVNEDKLFDVPRFFADKQAYDFAFFRSFFAECNVFITNIRYAVAGADSRNTLITEGRFVTNGILFDTNSDNIKPESGSVLKEIAAVLKENPTVRVKIIGHTDSDGNDASNLSLSQKRAAAVKMSLNSFYDIDNNRMETDGKGESQPIKNNSTPADKALNRRVEFIKL